MSYNLLQEAYKHHFLTKIFASDVYRGPIDFFQKIAL